MDLFNRDELRRLAEMQDDVCISLYLPTYRNESDWSQNTTRLKNLLREARDQLRNQDYREDLIDEILADARQLIDRPAVLREDVGEGLAVFITPDSTEYFRLPLSFEEVAIVGDRFHLKPLFPLIAANNRFYLLALTKQHARLYQGTHESIGLVEGSDIPQRIARALRRQQTTSQADDEPENSLPGEEIQSADEESPDQLDEDPEEVLKQFFRDVDSDVGDYIDGEEVPLVLAGASKYLSLYREVNSYSHILDDEVVFGNPEEVDVEDLHSKAWETVEPVFRETENEELERFEQLFYQNEDMASDDFHEIIPGCAYSRVDTLFVPVGEYRWGRFDADSNTVEVHDSQQPGDGDLLNYAAVSAYLNGASIHALRPENMPGGRSIAATFRYSADVSAVENG